MIQSELHRETANKLRPTLKDARDHQERKFIADTIEFHNRRALELSARGK